MKSSILDTLGRVSLFFQKVTLVKGSQEWKPKMRSHSLSAVWVIATLYSFMAYFWQFPRLEYEN